eukprot:g6481.t1
MITAASHAASTTQLAAALLFLAVGAGAGPPPTLRVAASAAVPPLGGGAALPDFGYRNVAAFGAKADGSEDDTAAFAAALAAAYGDGGGFVFVPAGTYAVRGTLTVPPGVSLRGVNEYPYRDWGRPGAGARPVGTTLLAYAGRGNASAPAFIQLNANSGVVGLSVFYPEQNATQEPVPYPPAIRGRADNNAVRNVFLVNPYVGVDFATNACGRHLIDGLHGQPLSVGVAVDQCYDIGRILNVHFWPFWAPLKSAAFVWQTTHGVSFDLMRTDWEVVQDVFSFGYHVGLRLRSSGAGACNGQFSNVNFDDVDVGIDALATQEWACVVSNLNVANAGDGLVRVGVRANSSTAKLSVRGGSFWGALRQAVDWDGEGSFLRLSDSTVHAWDAARPAVDVRSGRAMLVGNVFKDAVGTAVRVGAAADRVVLTSNELAGNTLDVQNKLTLLSANHE